MTGDAVPEVICSGTDEEYDDDKAQQGRGIKEEQE